MRLRPGTLTFQTSTTLPSPSPCTPTRPSTLSDALFLCSVAFLGKFDSQNLSTGKPRLQWMPLALVLVLVLYAWLSGTRMRAVSNALMSMALRPFVCVAPTSIWVAFSLCRLTCHQKYWLVLSLPIAVRAHVLSARNIEQLTKNAALSSFVLSSFFSPHSHLAEAQSH